MNDYATLRESCPQCGGDVYVHRYYPQTFDAPAEGGEVECERGCELTDDEIEDLRQDAQDRMDDARIDAAEARAEARREGER